MCKIIHKRYPRVYMLLKQYGHGAAKAFEILYDAQRGSRYALDWIKVVRACSPGKGERKGANLEGANLSSANLQDANLYKANLEGATIWPGWKIIKSSTP